ncbi:Histone acetyltransferase complex subunit [Tulasnella sp. UAMH 9824]|nr:Histone acetyltransferase complex subunit [Tulasnella sp. UAMH 9824]
MEEAQQIAQDFIASLDNVPLEVKFLLEEINQKEKQAQELQRIVNNKILRANPRVPGGQAHKDLNFEAAIQPDIDKIQGLADDRVALAHRLVFILTRHCGRLEYDINRIRVAAGEAPLANAASTPAFDSGVSAISLRGNTVGDARVGLMDSTRTGSITLTAAGSISIPESAPSPPATASPNGPATKRRRVGGVSGSTGTVSNTPVVLSQVVPPPRQSRLAQSNANTNSMSARPSPPVQSSRRGAPSRLLQTHNDDAAGDDHDDPDDPTDPEDKQLYCFCRKLSYGEMIACDNDNCHYQWFHLPCVGIKPPLPEKWYCSECRTLMGHSDTSPPGTNYGATSASTTQGTERGGRKGRKK